MHSEERENTLRKLGNRTKREFRDTSNRLHQFQTFPVPNLPAFMYSSIIFFSSYKLQHFLRRRNVSKDYIYHRISYGEVY